jgi:hypothetical protein
MAGFSNTTPSATQFDGFYNVDPDCFGSAREYNRDHYLCVEKGLQPPELDELNNVTDLLIEYAANEGLTTNKIYYSVGFADRTAKFGFRNPNDMTSQRMEALRVLLEEKAPSWRVCLEGLSPETTIIIYPSLIAYPTTESPIAQLSRIQVEDLDYNDRIKGTVQRQMNYVAAVVKNRIEELKSTIEFPVFLAVFDRAQGDDENFCVWLFDRGYRHQGLSSLPGDSHGDGLLGVISGTQKDVTSAGIIVDYLEAKRKFVGCVCALIYSKAEFKGYCIFENANGTTFRRELSLANWIDDKSLM